MKVFHQGTSIRICLTWWVNVVWECLCEHDASNKPRQARLQSTTASCRQRRPQPGNTCLRVPLGVCLCLWASKVCQWASGSKLSVSSHQSQYQAGQSRWCSCRWKGVCRSCCPRRRPWRWTGPGAHRRRSSSPTSWPLAGHSGRSQPLWSGAYVEGSQKTGGIKDRIYIYIRLIQQCVVVFFLLLSNMFIQ